MAVTAAPGDRLRHLALFYHGNGEYRAVLRGLIQASRAAVTRSLDPLT
jgi:hypothetical protein